MSRIYFHSPVGESEVRGAERAYMGSVVSDLGVALLNPRWRRDDLLRLLPAGHFLNERATLDTEWAERFRLYTSAGDMDLVIEGERVDAFTIYLNTCLAVGGDPLRLFARLHGSCEIHAWVDGPNRAWLADIIREGRAAGLFRADMGWEDVADFLGASSADPVVTSYSVTEGFPDWFISDHYPAWPVGVPERWNALTAVQQEARQEAEEAWHDLPDLERWDSAMRGLRSNASRGLEMRPDNWSDFRFGHSLDAFTVQEKARALAE